MKRPRKLLLFDIDGTLVDTGGVGLASLRDGFWEAFPEHCDASFPSLDLGGATDHGVARRLFDHFRIEDSRERRDHFYASYTTHLERQLHLSSNAGRGRSLPGVAECLERLSGHGGYCLGLLTGNLRKGAAIKLRHFGLDRHFTAAAGAYGDDHHDRNELGPIARRRAVEVFGENFPAEDIVVIGDTLRDIACARAFGAKVLAVATGAASRNELETGRPDGLMDDVSRIDQVEQWLQSGGSAPTDLQPASGGG